MENLNEMVEANDLIYVKKNKNRFIFVFVAFVVLAVAAALIFLLISGNKNLTYRQAEKMLIEGMASEAAQANNGYNTVDFEISIKPYEELFSMLNPTVLKGKMIVDVENGGSYMDISYLNGDKTILSLMECIKDNYLYFGLPSISDVILSVKMINETQENAASNFDSDKAYKTMDSILDKYFEITDSKASEKGVEVELNGITKKCDRYTVVIDAVVLKEFLIAACDIILENNNLTDYISSAYEIDSVYYINEFVDMLNSKDYNDLSDFSINMDAYINENDIVKREIVIKDENQEALIDIFNLENENEYAQKVSFSYDGDNIIYNNTGTKSEGKYTGEAVFDINSGNNLLSNNTFEIEYKDLQEYENGLASGTYKIFIPAAGSEVNITSEVNGDTAVIKGDVSALSMKLFETEITLKVEKDGKIEFNQDKVSHIGDIEDTDNLLEKLQEYISGIEEFDFADDDGQYDFIGYIFNPFFENYMQSSTSEFLLSGI